ncbi:glycosyltransferase family 2 protein [Albirhodobacter sp. R86504]|uniref:glycosyltransferase family 2 protein n=1 Tax=Albirhodobacter sp. R86504 TaxID=3093848 RepID=UPI00366FE6E7
MATYNGARFVQEQLDSIAAQIGVDWQLVVSDDGSTDETAAIVAAFSRAHPGRVRWVEGPRQGPCANFRHLINHIPANADLVAFSDQDDVWTPLKLERAVHALSQEPSGKCALYCSRTIVVNDDLTHKSLSRKLRVNPSFSNAIIQNIAGGNTMVINRHAVKLMKAVNSEAGEIVIHDWWIYQIITGVGGAVFFDHEPCVMYRQHGNNVIGHRSGFYEAIQRIISADLKKWNKTNVAALTASSHRFTTSNKKTLDAFNRAISSQTVFRRLHALWQSGVHRQSMHSNIALWIDALMNRL